MYNELHAAFSALAAPPKTEAQAVKRGICTTVFNGCSMYLSLHIFCNRKQTVTKLAELFFFKEMSRCLLLQKY